MSHLFITGFMGAGKSTVGRMVSRRLGRPFVDLDAEIESREGMTVAELFRTRGEDGFRDAEHAALEALVAEGPAVVATGGGVVLREDNQILLKRHGVVVYLAVTPEEAMARLGDGATRPLLADGGLGAARSILDARLAMYRATADYVIETVGRSPAEVAEGVIEVFASGASRDSASTAPIQRDTAERQSMRVGVAGDPRGYDIVIGGGLLDEVGERLSTAEGPRSVALVSDEVVWELFGSRVAASLAAAGMRVSEHIVAPGEVSKSWGTAGYLLERFAAAGLDRASTVVSLGGGVIGDLAGFCAATYVRGIDLVHVPTTLLAQVDSAIGGKTAVDLSAGKNLAGAFWPPRLVLSDTDALAWLPDLEWTNGLVEAAKTALLAGGDMLDRFERSTVEVMAHESTTVRAIVADSAGFKARVVTDDLRETGGRESLNLGHTLGHALELLAGYGALPHGLAVAEGMRFASDLSVETAGASGELVARTEVLLESIGAGRAVCRDALGPMLERADAAGILAAMKADKKSRAGTVRFVLLEAPGRWRVAGVDDTTLLTALEAWLARMREEGA